MSQVTKQQHGWDVNPDIEYERQRSSFRAEELTNALDGGIEKTKRRRYIETLFLGDPNLRATNDYYYLSHEEKYRESLIRARKIAAVCKDLEKNYAHLGKWSADFIDMQRLVVSGRLSACFYPEGSPLSVHFGLYVATIMNQGTPEQQDEWFEKATTLQNIGTYAQTELGHGSNVRGIETTATFDPVTDEFVMHTPSFSAYKWWPGAMGRGANHAAVVAQLIIKGKNRGIYSFIVPIRDLKTGKTLPGVHVGNLGPKAGLDTFDNGYLGLCNVRIPRQNMLMRFGQVHKDGTFQKSPFDKACYLTLVFSRIIVALNMADIVMRIATISVRYAAVRRQGELTPGTGEMQLLDYRTHQVVLLPAIAAGLATMCATKWMWRAHDDAMARLKQGRDVSISEMHAQACAIKAVTSSEAAEIVEACRRAVGGAGLLCASGFPQAFCQADGASTYDGENTILLLQVARYLIKPYHSAAREGRTPQLIEPTRLPAFNQTSASSNESEYFIQSLVDSFKAVVDGLTRYAFSRMAEKVQDGMSPMEAWNHASVSLLQCAKAYCRSFVVSTFFDTVKNWNVSPELHTVALRLCELYAIHWLLRDSGNFIIYGGIRQNDIELLQRRRDLLLELLRPEAVTLVDSFDFHDDALRSPLGCRDGRALERTFLEVTGCDPNEVTKQLQNPASNTDRRSAASIRAHL